MCRPSPLLRLVAPALAVLLALAPPAWAECLGRNLIDSLSEADRLAVAAATDRAPFARGTLWRATRGAQTVHLVGTYHLDDPRHAAMMARVTPLIDAAATVLVEAGPEEEAALKARISHDPSLMVITEGPTLREALPDAEWALLADAMRERGMPPFLVSKLRPWYVSMLLSLPACGLEGMEAPRGGLDGLVIARAQERAIRLRALEPHDTVFRVFDAMPMGDQLAMIRSSLALEPMSEDYAVTLADAYFAGETRLIWELTRQLSHALPGQDPARLEADFARMEQALMTDRNRAWIPVIESAAQEGPVLAAFGALHLPGENGVLRLLQEAGFVIEPLGP